MPRPKPKSASPTFLAHPRPISDRTAKALAKSLGRSLDIKLRDTVERAIGLAIDGAQHDHVPRPADYVAEFRAIAGDALNLANKLGNWSYYYTDQFARHGEDVHAIEQSIVRIVTVAGAVVKEFEGKPSKGARSETARTAAIRMLSELFDREVQGPIRGRGARKIDFVTTALREHRVIPLGFTGIPAILRSIAKEK